MSSMTTTHMCKLRQLRIQLDDQETRAHRLTLVSFPEGVDGKIQWHSQDTGFRRGNIWSGMCTQGTVTMPSRWRQTPYNCDQVLGFSDTVKIINAAQNKSLLHYGNSTIIIFRDMSIAQKEENLCFPPWKEFNFQVKHPTTGTMDLGGGRCTFTIRQASKNNLRKYHPDGLPQD